MNKNDIEYFKGKLEAELLKLESELKSIGRINPSNPNDWEAVQPDIETMPGDENETASVLEAYEENSAVLGELEIQYNEVKHALDKIEVGTYGTCESTGKPIPKERLEANPSARTCLIHTKVK
jgi:RNA polymerase-binding transcription factor DksA